MSEVQKKWYVLRAISGKEHKVKEYIDYEIAHDSLGGFVSQVLIPTEKTVQIRNGKNVVKERSYLPGYVLVEAALVGEIAHHLRNVPNVLGFLGGLDNPTPLRLAEVNRILGTVDEMMEVGVEDATSIISSTVPRIRFTSDILRGVGLSRPPRKPNTLGILRR